MCEIKDLLSETPHVAVFTDDDKIHIMPISLIRRLATGQMALSECESPEEIGMCLAKLAMEKLDGIN